MKLYELTNELRNRLNDKAPDNDGEYTGDELKKFINEALSWFCRVLKIYKQDEAMGTGTSVNLTKVFDPTMVVANRLVDNKQKYWGLVKKSEEDINDLYPIPIENNSGEPRYFYTTNRVCYIFPTEENATYSISVRGFAVEQLDDDDDDSIVIREDNLIPFMDACEYFARKSRLTVEGNAQLLTPLYNAVLGYFAEKGAING